MEARALVARQVHRDLHDAAALKFEAERLQMQESAVALAHRARDAPCDRQVARVQRDVVRDEQRSHAYDASASRRVHARLSNVRRAFRVRADLFAQQLESTAPHVRKIFSFRPQRRALVEVDGYAKLAPDSLARTVRERDALFDAYAADGDERQHVARAHARVLRRVRVEVNQLRRARHDAHRRLDRRTGRRDEGYDRAVVIRVNVRAEDERALDRLDRLDQARDHIGPAPLAEVWYTLDDAIHLPRSLVSLLFQRLRANRVVGSEAVCDQNVPIRLRRCKRALNCRPFSLLGRVCIARGHLDVGVPHQFGDDEGTHAPVTQARAERVAEIVEAEVFNLHLHERLLKRGLYA